MENEKYSCLDCIWHDQCESEEPCGFFDRGRYGLELSEDEIHASIESNREKYNREYQKYIQEFN